MNIELINLVKENRLSSCLSCGACSSVCPITPIYRKLGHYFSPRVIIRKSVLACTGVFKFDALREETIWFCLLSCDACEEICPARVSFSEFIKSLRILAVNQGVKKLGVKCSRCGRYFLPIHLNEYYRKTLSFVGAAGFSLPDNPASLDFLTLCPTCRKRYFSQKVKALIPESKRVYE